MSIPAKRIAVLGALMLGVASHISAGQAADTATRIEIYGFAQVDAIGDFKTNNPDWFDVNRPSELPAVRGEFGRDGHTWFSARQSRFGTKATIPTSTKDITITFEWDLLGVGADAGLTTIRPRLMYGQWGDFGGGQLRGPFTDVDVRPPILDGWGPSAMLDYRNVQVFWQPVHRDGGTRVTFALERPGASGDAGLVSDRLELQNIIAHFTAPDISGEYRVGGKCGYAKLAAIVRWIGWDDVLPDAFDLSGHVTGWGLSLSSGINVGKYDVIHLQTVYGAGVETYIKDAPVDVGPERNPGSSVKPIKGEALPDRGVVAFVDHRWAAHFTTSFGYSRVDIDNSDLQAPTDFKRGQYALVNLIWTPVPDMMAGGELQWARRDNFGGGFHANDYRLQFALKYSFLQRFAGGSSSSRPIVQ
jgi:outer membrane DcaP-like protein